jgi:hypothetical protein
MRWRLELASFKVDIIYYTLVIPYQITTAISSGVNLTSFPYALCHQGITQMNHWLHAKNLSFSIDDIGNVTNSCPVCNELKPQFVKNEGKLIKATSPFEKLNLDFKGPLPTKSKNQYLLMITDEFSRFPFATPCLDLSAGTVIKHLTHIFPIFGMPSYMHSDKRVVFYVS